MFKLKPYPRSPRQPLKRIEGCRGVYAGPSLTLVAVPKSAIHRSEAYRRWVASLPCISCGIADHSQCAHSNSPEHGKAKGLKASDENTFPLCGPHGLHQGCHVLFDTGMDYTREQRRELAVEWAAKTQALAIADGWRFTEEGILKP